MYSKLHVLIKTSCANAASSAAPTSVRVSAVTSSSITVQWGAVDCIHHNGDITGYYMRYEVEGWSTSEIEWGRYVTGGGSVTETTISVSITGFKVYKLRIAAVNSAGTGVYSHITISVPRGMCIIILCVLLYIGWGEHVPSLSLKIIIVKHSNSIQCHVLC